MHIRSSPVFLGTNKTGLPHGTSQTLLNPFDKAVSSRSFNSFLFFESLYTRSIFCLRHVPDIWSLSPFYLEAVYLIALLMVRKDTILKVY